MKTASVLVVATIGLAMILPHLGCRDDSQPPASPGNQAGQSTTTQPATTQATTTPAATATAGGVDLTKLPEGLDAEHYVKARKLLDGGAAYIMSKRESNGAWSAGRGSAVPAITGMALRALVTQPGFGLDNQDIAKAFEVMLSYRQEDGGIYQPGQGPASYTSAVVLMALAAADDPRFAPRMREQVAYLKGLQIVPGSDSSDQEIAEDDPRVGGVGYGKGPGRPDLSNVGMWMDALHDAGVPADDPAMQRAVAFVSRLQSSTETNKLSWAKLGDDDGGFVYTFPSEGPDGAMRGLRSYGSMTYTGFKSLLYAGVDRKDPRVRAARDWIGRYWRLDSNPNMPQAQSRAGLYYYYHVFAKAMRAWGEPQIKDAEGNSHNWRHELIDAIASQVNADGSWVNEADRWWEGNPVLATSYVMMALEEAMRE